jgi:hypothetical protein
VPGQPPAQTFCPSASFLKERDKRSEGGWSLAKGWVFGDERKKKKEREKVERFIRGLKLTSVLIHGSHRYNAALRDLYERYVSVSHLTGAGWSFFGGTDFESRRPPMHRFLYVRYFKTLPVSIFFGVAWGNWNTFVRQWSWPNQNTLFLSFLFFYFLGVGWDLSPLGTSATNWLIVPDEDECGAVGGTKIGRGNRSTRRNPAPVPLYLPQIPYDLIYFRTRAAEVRSRRLKPPNYCSDIWGKSRFSSYNINNVLAEIRTEYLPITGL